MRKNLTIMIEEDVYKGLLRKIGRKNISQFVENIVRPHVIDTDPESAYCAMAQDEQREQEAFEWAEITFGMNN